MSSEFLQNWTIERLTYGWGSEIRVLLSSLIFFVSVVRNFYIYLKYILEEVRLYDSGEATLQKQYVFFGIFTNTA